MPDSTEHLELPGTRSKRSPLLANPQARTAAHTRPSEGWVTPSSSRSGTSEVSPVALRPRDLLFLQRNVGNKATSQALDSEANPPALIQRAKPRRASPKSEPVVQRAGEDTYVPYQVQVTRPMTREEFRAAALRQILGRVRDDLEWRNSKDTYVPADSPYTVRVSTRLLKQERAEVRKDRGIGVDEAGGVSGAASRAEAFQSGPESAQKTALMDEIDRRYFAAVGDPTNTKIKTGEQGKAALWRMIRDEVLFQHEYIANLPEQVKKLIKISVKGKTLTPADYDRLFAIARKIERMPPGLASDYASKVTGSTTDLSAFEAALDAYRDEMGKRGLQDAEREAVQTKLIGLEEIYKKYRLYKDLLTSGGMSAAAGASGMPGGAGVGLGTARASSKLRKELNDQLKPHGFAGVAEFETYIAKFERAFEHGAAGIASDLLKRYAGKLYRESERYQDPAEVAALHQELGGVRTQYTEFEKNAKIWNDYKLARQQSRLPGQGHLRPKVTFSEADAARKKAEAAKATAQAEVKGMSGDHPILQEEGLPLDKRIDKATLARASESQLGPLLRGHIKNRMGDIDEALARIDDKPELIYKMDKLLPQFYALQGIRVGSIHDMIIRDKMRSDAIIKIVKGIAMAIVAVALAVVTFGTATPAIIAAGAGIAGAGLGAYMALEEYEQYTEEKDLADVGLTKDPSVAWLVLAVVGAGLDMAAAVKAVRALAPAAKALNAGGELADFTKAVRALEQANEIEARIARAAEKAAAARTGLAEASVELGKAMSRKLYSFPGPLADPDVYKAVVKMARQAIKTKIYDAQKFIDELRLLRTKAGLSDLNPEELAKAKQAWQEAKALEVADQGRYEKLLRDIPDAARLDSLVARAGDVAKLERLLQVFPVAELESIFTKLSDTGRLATMVEHLGSETSAGMIRQWMSKGKDAAMNQFLERLAGGVGRELAETGALGSKTLIIDSQTAIALIKDADPTLSATMHAGEKARVAFIKSLPADTELRIGSVTVGEIEGGVIKVKGLPIDVARESPEYRRVLNALDTQKVGKASGFADRAVIADAFFARTGSGVTPKFLTADQNVVKKLAGMAGIDVNAAGGYPGLLRTYGSSGFNVTIEARTLTIIPVP